MVRPFIAPWNTPFSPIRVSFISLGSAQWFVGPASSSFSQQMKVRDSTRATSEGNERAKNEFGRFSGFKRVKIPASTSSCDKRSHSSWEPSQNSIDSGVVIAATLATHLTTSSGAFAGAAARTSDSVTAIKGLLHRLFLLHRNYRAFSNIVQGVKSYAEVNFGNFSGSKGRYAHYPERCRFLVGNHHPDHGAPRDLPPALLRRLNGRRRRNNFR